MWKYRANWLAMTGPKTRKTLNSTLRARSNRLGARSLPSWRKSRIDLDSSLTRLGFQIRKQVLEAGGRVQPFYPLQPEDIPFWQQRRNDRERFRSIAIDGGEHGELGPGFRAQNAKVEMSDSGAKAAADHHSLWTREHARLERRIRIRFRLGSKRSKPVDGSSLFIRYTPKISPSGSNGAMTKEDFGFDGVLGKLGPLEIGPEPKGLTLDQVLSGIRVQNLALKDNASEATKPKEHGKDVNSEDLKENSEATKSNNGYGDVFSSLSSPSSS
ncbi:hypothetical protein MMC07_006505 [Pseudocyphellaria aurata]|nr:hypothetical protein [Pseudocyphellaria aurata]